MLGSLVKKVFGSRNERVLRSLEKRVSAINALEPEIQKLSDDALRAKTEEFRGRLAQGIPLDALLPEAFAVVREASVRTLQMRHFDVQLIGGMVLHGGKIAEMRTGEGKTLGATLPAYLNAISSKGVHIITVNDYLASRDAEWMRPVYEFLGLTVDVIVAEMEHAAKQEAYRADITYGTNNEFGFDYLRDNMAFSLEDKVQRELNYAIVDEVDSILIDEARTPLIISGAADDSSELYRKINKIIPSLTKQEAEDGPGDYSVDEKQKQAFLTEDGHQKMEELLVKAELLKVGDSLYSPSNIGLMHHVSAALRAHALFSIDVDYIVANNEIVIVDEHTGRTMPGRRWSEGLHQAIEAKENVKIQNENQTLASITFQNYFRLYNKLAGMTGTADTEAYEFQQIYNLEVVVIPTNMPMIRNDQADLVFLNQGDKFKAVIEDVEDCVKRGQPVLVGTASIETSEYIDGLLNKAKIKHQVLNAKFHEKEATIIADAGRPGTVTIATNMAGRGTDIVLGGNLDSELQALADDVTDADREAIKQDWQQRHDTVLKAGGFRIIGSERHESRRIDNQLRGRAGRQGDAGSSRFYLSLDDNLMRIFASDRVSMILQKLGMQEGEAIEHPWVTKAVENAQRKVEGHNFDIRKNLLEYDNVANDQRKVVYANRTQLMGTEDVSEHIQHLIGTVVSETINPYVPPDSMEEQWDVSGLEHQLKQDFATDLKLVKWLEEDSNAAEAELREKVQTAVYANYESKQAQLGEETMRQFEKSIILQTMDNHWREHLGAMDHLRQGIHLRGYAQKDPKQEYKRESFQLFNTFLTQFKHDVISIICLAQIQTESDVEAAEAQRLYESQMSMSYQHAAPSGLALAEGENAMAEPLPQTPVTRDEPKIGRNDPCSCGSGKKYKQCHGRLA